MRHSTLQQKIGQLFLLGFTGASVSAKDPIASAISREHLGGVILFDRFLAGKQDSNNIINAEQLQQLTADLQSMAGGDLLIAVDQEGGRVNRFRPEMGFPVTPAAAELGDGADLQATVSSARQTAKMLRTCGVNVNLAPVVDLNLNRNNPIIGVYGRSFSEDGGTVAAHAAAWITEHRAEGIHCCLKHFPGHGSSHSDSHQGFVDITTTWQKVELEPYRNLIAQGLAEAVMVGHLINRQFDPFHPATLSHATLQGILRGHLGFAGLVVSDDMQMKAITNHYGLAEACCRALAAGVDLLIIGNNLAYDSGILRTVKTAIEQAVARGELAAARIEEACATVQKFKRSLLRQPAAG